MTTLTQFRLDHSLVDCGMSYAFTLADGSFFLVDGGYFTPGEDERLYQWLLARAKGKPRIAGWFFSHAHQDHIGVFLNMMLHHRQDIELERLIFNFQPLALPPVSDGWDIKSNDLATVKKFYELLAAACPEVPVITPHTGDSLRLRELSLDFLFTHESLPGESTFNDHSTVLRVTVQGQRILFLGDIYRLGSEYLLRSPEALRCDMVQIAHHGFPGATAALYDACGASVALWPTADYCIPRLREDPVNRHVLEHPGIRRHIFSGEGTVELNLPYRPDQGEKART